MTEALIVYGVIGLLWAVYCLGMGYVVSSDKHTSRLLFRGFWLTPIWPLIMLALLPYALHDLWKRAWR